MKIDLNKQDIKTLNEFKTMLYELDILPRLWINHTEYTCKRDMFKKIIDKINKQI